MRAWICTIGIIYGCYYSLSHATETATGSSAAQHPHETTAIKISEQSEHEFIQLLEQSANSGSAAAALALGNRYFHGKDVAKNLPTAVHWWQQAAELGSADAAYNLGVAYVHGYGATKNLDNAHAAFVQAAQKGFAKAQLALGILGLQAAQSQSELTKAGQYFKQAAEQGDPIAKENLALMYEQGIGYTLDVEQAQYWRTYEPATATTQIALEKESSTGSINSTDWVLSRDPQNYTLQLVSGDTFADTERLITGIDSLQCAIFNKSLANHTRFVAVAGDFGQYSKALEALQQLPDKLRKNEPFIVKFSVLQRQIDEHTKFNN